MGLLTILTLSACAPAVTSTEPVGYQAGYDEVFDYVHYLMSVATPFEVASANRYSGSITAEYRVGAPGRTTSTWGVVAAITGSSRVSAVGFVKFSDNPLGPSIPIQNELIQFIQEQLDRRFRRA